MRLYNTLTKKIEEFTPLDSGKVRFFVCGPTVYDYSHIGHAKTYVQLDILARVLRQSSYEVFYLQNITDIDDKIITRAAEKNVSWEELRSTYEAEYYKDMETLGNISVTRYARATDHIEDIIRQVQVLIKKGHAYTIDDGIYFEIATFPEYGKLSGRREVQENDALARIDQSDQKRGWNDFCLWKFARPDEPVWEAPFGNGRPGWHIEDTAITEHFFGPQYDIHGGAVDLIFPHHEAEITQMESASGKVPFVKYWAHTGFLNIDNAKMSKSLGNFFTIREVLKKGYDPMAVRLFMLQSHYRSSINFSWELLDAAQARLKNLQAVADLRFQPYAEGNDIGKLLKLLRQEVNTALVNDLGTPEALAALSKLEAAVDKGSVSTSSQESLGEFFTWLDDILGLCFSSSADLDPSAKKLLGERATARANGDWAKADAIRKTLSEKHLDVKDTSVGQVWSRTLPNP